MKHTLMDFSVMSIIIEAFQQSIKFTPPAENDSNRFIVEKLDMKLCALAHKHTQMNNSMSILF